MIDPIAAGAIAAAISAALMPIVWYMLRENRAAMNGVARELSDLTLVMALDVATRTTANPATRRIARDMVRRRDGVRARELNVGGEDDGEP